MYKEESEKIKNILDDIIIDIHHIGSTAIPRIKAKPVIDILVEVKDIEAVDQYNHKMEELGYEMMGEYGIPKRRFFRKGKNNRTHHIHIFQTGNEEIKRHINFKEYLIAHPDRRQEYSKFPQSFRWRSFYFKEGQAALFFEVHYRIIFKNIYLLIYIIRVFYSPSSFLSTTGNTIIFLLV